jgi:hypothetical protein
MSTFWHKHKESKNQHMKDRDITTNRSHQSELSNQTREPQEEQQEHLPLIHSFKLW